MYEEKSIAGTGQLDHQKCDGVRSMIVAYEELCQQILSVDRGIRFVGVTDYQGNVLAAKYREDVEKALC